MTADIIDFKGQKKNPGALTNAVHKSVLELAPGLSRPTLNAAHKTCKGISNLFSWASKPVTPIIEPFLKTKAGQTLKDLLLNDIGFISATSMLLAVTSFGHSPATAIAAISLASVIGLKGYQSLLPEGIKDRINTLFEDTKFETFLNRKNAGYSLSSLLSGLATTTLVAAMIAGSITATIPAIAIAATGIAFAVSNNIKAARRDDVKPWFGLDKIFNKAASEKIAIFGNITRNFIAGPIAGIAATLVYSEGLKFSFKDSAGLQDNNRSYTDNHISPKMRWTKPKSDDGMSRAAIGVASGLAASWALVTGNIAEAAALFYPTYAQFKLAADGHEAYANKIKAAEAQDTANNPAVIVANDNPSSATPAIKFDTLRYA